MKKIDWLEDFAKSEKAKQTATPKKVASKKNKVSVASADIIVLDKAGKLLSAKEGQTVKYQNIKWRIINASYKDGKGTGIMLERVAGIDTKPLTSPETRARNEVIDNLDYNVRETTEVPDFQAAAAATEQQIAKENAVDHATTPAARYQNPVLMDNNDVPAEETALASEDSVDFEGVDENIDEAVAEEPEAAEASEETGIFDDIDIKEPVEETVEEEKEDEEEAKTAATKKQNRILASILGKKK